MTEAWATSTSSCRSSAHSPYNTSYRSSNTAVPLTGGAHRPQHERTEAATVTRPLALPATAAGTPPPYPPPLLTSLLQDGPCTSLTTSPLPIQQFYRNFHTTSSSSSSRSSPLKTTPQAGGTAAAAAAAAPAVPLTSLLKKGPCTSFTTSLTTCSADFWTPSGMSKAGSMLWHCMRKGGGGGKGGGGETHRTLSARTGVVVC